MDFYNLSRKQLQALCKKNKIPANITNLAMAEALAARHQVEGLDEILNQVEEEKVVGTPDVHHTASRTSTRRKDVDIPATPAMPSSRRQAALVSTRRKKEAQIPEDDEKNDGQGKPTDVPITPAAPTTRTRAYNTRRSVRLSEKNLSRMNLLDTQDIGLAKIDDVSEDISNVSKKTGISDETDEKKTDELEVTSQEKNTEYELSSGLENAVRGSLLAEPEDPNLKLEGSSETCNDSNEVCDKPVVKAVNASDEAEAGMLSELEDSCDSKDQEDNFYLGTKEDASTEVSEKASMEVTNHNFVALSLSVEKPGDASVEFTGQDNIGSHPMSSVDKTGNQGGDDPSDISALSNEASEDASTEFVDENISTLTVEVLVDASVGATDQDVAVSLSVSSVSNNSEILEGTVACNTDKLDSNDCVEISTLSVESEYASMEAINQDMPAFYVDIADQDVVALSIAVPDDASMEPTDQDIAGSLSVSSVCSDSVSLQELVANETAKQGGSDSTEISDDTSMSLLTCIVNTQVDGDFIPEEIAIPKQESSMLVEAMKHEKRSSTEVHMGKIDEVMLSTVTVAPIYEQVKEESHCLPQSGPKKVADEHLRVQEEKVNMMKENTNVYESMSIRELKKMLKNLKLDSKSNGKNNDVNKEVDRKRAALQVLPENQMTAEVTKNDS